MRLLRNFTLICICLLVSSVATAQSDGQHDDLWTAYQEAATQFSESYAVTDSVDPMATRGNRLYKRAIDDGEALIGVLEQLLDANAPATEDEQLAIIDALLTTGQIIGSLQVEVQECSEGKIDLEKVLEHPGIASRPILRDSTQTWLDRANDCIQRQEVEQARAERERQIAELERQIDSEQDEAQLEALRAQLAELEGVDPALYGVGEEQGPVNIAPIAVLATGVAVMAGGAIWDLTLNDERDTIDEYRGLDVPTVQEFDAAQEAADAVDSAKAPIAVMYGVGGAATVAGAIWLAIKPRRDAPETDEETMEPEPEVSFNPVFGRGSVGVNLNARF